MSEFPETVYMAYVEGELDPDVEREFELHLVRSREARQRIVELQEEVALLRDVLQERPARNLRTDSGRAPARGLALGLAPALGVAVVLTAAVGSLAELKLPGGIDWMSPFQLIGAYEMLFDLIFWLRDEAPQLLELVIAVVATAGLSALLTFAVTVAFRRLSGTHLASLVVLVAVGLLGRDAAAIDLRFHAETVTVANDETIEEALVVSGENLYVDGVIDGDLVAVVDRAVIRGEVKGDVFALARSLEITGTIHGSLRSVTERVDLDGQVKGDVTSLAEEFSLTSDGKIQRDATTLAEQASVDGEVGRHLFVGAERLELRGTVGGSADLRGKRLEVMDGARIAGDLSSQLEEGFELQIDDGATIGGEVTREPLEHDFGHGDRRFSDPDFYLHRIVILTSAFLVGMLLHFFAPAIFRGRMETSPEFFRSLGFGALVLIGAPIAIALCAVTIVGIPIALIVAGLYLTGLFVAFTVIAALIGRTILRRDPDSTAGFAITLLAGLVVLAVAISLPWIGKPLGWLTMLAGLGLLVDSATQTWWRPRRPAQAF
jgi:cytoskeletal protein CcmA (bactofilin family)